MSASGSTEGDWPGWLTARPIAHRGYHDLASGRAENSWSAFAAAIDAGFAIECDVQVSATGEPVVFHDPELDRMTGRDGLVRDLAPDDLAAMRLAGTDDTIYTLRQHLVQVAGRVPLVIELKGIEGEDAGFVEGVAAALEGYAGPACVMSFDPWIVRQFAPLMPNIPRGLTAEGGSDAGPKHAALMAEADLQFVSYDIRNIACPFVRSVRDSGLPVITWTVRTREQVAACAQHADQMTFEGFDPRDLPDAW